MIEPAILEKLEHLPQDLQQKVLHYIDTLMAEQDQALEPEIPSKKRRVAGTMKGMIQMSDDFDEPLEDFKDYM